MNVAGLDENFKFVQNRQMDSRNYTDQINDLFRHLLKIHKTLLDFQKLVMESLEQKRYSPYETLNLAMNHPDFEWLRKISRVMAEMDESTSDKKNLPDEKALKDFARRLNDIFSESNPDMDFKNRFKIAVDRDAKLSGQVSELRAELAKLV